MLLTAAADERAAMQFEELASAIDAGLSLESLGGDPGAGERVVQTLLTKRKVRLSASEDAVISGADITSATEVVPDERPSRAILRRSNPPSVAELPARRS